MGLIKFYYSPISPPCRVVWMVFRELGLPFEPVLIDFGKNEQRTPWFLELNDRGQVPVIKDGEFTLGESRAIIAYLGCKYGGESRNPDLYPNGCEVRAKVNEMLLLDAEKFSKISAFIVSSPQEYVVTCMVKDCENNKEVWHSGGTIKHCNKKAAVECLKVYENILGKRPYIALDWLTVADYTALSTITFIEQGRFDDWSQFPNISAWRRRMEQLPYYNECWENYHQKLLKMYQKKEAENNRLKSKY